VGCTLCILRGIGEGFGSSLAPDWIGTPRFGDPAYPRILIWQKEEELGESKNAQVYGEGCGEGSSTALE